MTIDPESLTTTGTGTALPILERIHSFPLTAKHFHCFEQDSCIKNHAAYKAAKAGNPAAAVQLIKDLALGFLNSIENKMPANCIFVSPYAKEATGDNALPLILSVFCAALFNGISEDDIIQRQRVFHTGADPMERLVTRPSFEGDIIANRDYILVDDVTSMGGTLAELANYIQLNHGRIAGTVTLVNAGRNKSFNAVAKHIKLLQERFGDEIRKTFGIHTHALTANEASYLVGFRTLDEIRNRRIKAEKEIHLRLLSKNYC